MKVITGCMRSGTSFVARVIHELGADFGGGGELIDGDRWNPDGYFENRTVNTLNHRLLFGPWSRPELWVDVMWPGSIGVHLRKLGTSAMAPAIAHPSLVRRRGRRYRDRILSVADAFAGKVVKDPRFSYLMEAWEEAAEPESVLYVIRNPRGAALSMSRQTRLPVRLTYLSWGDAVSRFWRRPPKAPTSVVDFDALLDPARRVEEARSLYSFLGKEYSRDSASQLLDRLLRADRPPPDTGRGRLPRKIGKLYRSVLDRKGAQ